MWAPSKACARRCEQLGMTGSAVAYVGHGMTTATNAVIQRIGAKTAFVTNHGFKDLLLIGRQDRPSLYDIDVVRAPPLVPRELCYGIAGRLDSAAGRSSRSTRPQLAEAAADMRAQGVEAVAVTFLHAYANPTHERAAKAVLSPPPAGHRRLHLVRHPARVPRVRARQHGGAERLPHAGDGELSPLAVHAAARCARPGSASAATSPSW